MMVSDSMGFVAIEINKSFVVLGECCKGSSCFDVGHVIGLVGADPSDMVVSPSCKCHAGPSANAVRLKGALAVIDFDGCITADEGTSTL